MYCTQPRTHINSRALTPAHVGLTWILWDILSYIQIYRICLVFFTRRLCNLFDQFLLGKNGSSVVIVNSIHRRLSRHDNVYIYFLRITSITCY